MIMLTQAYILLLVEIPYASKSTGSLLSTTIPAAP